MQVYEVGGAVRDALLGEPVTDRDWVVVGATPQQMVDAGFRPVGRDFPVFLHPDTHEEYALARTERKSGRGYHGFVVHAAPDVTLEEDLGRRDLTINAMARAADGTVIDPFGGRRDLTEGVLRHVSPAFAEDPVRLLRLARFAARWPRFRVADDTMALLRELVRAGEVDALVPERVWQELARGLCEIRPSRMLEVLRACGALARLLPEVDALWAGVQDLGSEDATAARDLLAAIDEAARRDLPRPARFALLALDPRPGAEPTSERAQAVALRWRVPQDDRELAMLLGREAAALRAAAALDADNLVRLLDRCDAWRRGPRLDQALQAAGCAGVAAGAIARIRSAWARALTVDARSVSAHALDKGHAGVEIAHALFAARRDAIHTGLTPG